MPGTGLGRKTPKRHTEHYQSSETADTILAGSPVAFTMSGTDDGGLVENLDNSPSVAAATSLLAGVALQQAGPGEVLEVADFGYIAELRVIRGSRAASTASYASSPAIAVGDKLDLHTVGNGVSRAGAAASGALHPFVALESKASSASAASTTSDSSLLRVDKMKAFVRLM